MSSSRLWRRGGYAAREVGRLSKTRWCIRGSLVWANTRIDASHQACAREELLGQMRASQ
ncbi:hypothetical protein [Streptomyces sp. NPDC014995]|uniref:hypothetical protein n=1 Tax=Streptomyces sp. NPDC014995 TaxID=3364936 RepID=UPI0036F87DFD